MSFETIRKMLSSYLHQDYDIDGSIADVLVLGVKHTDREKLLKELNELESQSDDTVKEVLDDHDVHLWNDVTPRNLLTTLQTLTKLAKY